MRRAETQLVICIKNRGYAASLELRKIYQTKPDQAAEKLKHLRVIDESGEDYLYPEGYFIGVQLPHATEKAILHAANGKGR